MNRPTTLPTTRPAPSFAQFFAYRRFQPTLAFTPDSAALLMSINISGQFNLWRVPVAGGWPDQLTDFDDRAVRSVAPAPDGSIAFNADRNGDESYQLYGIGPSGGWPSAWTDDAGVQHHLLPGCWSPDGRQLAFAANRRRPTDVNVWVRDTATGEVRHVFGTDGFALPVSYTPDGSGLLCLDVVQDNDDERLHLVNLGTGESRALTTRPARVKPGPWAPDGSGFWVSCDLDREFAGLGFFHLSEDRLEWVATPDHDIEEVAGDPAGNVLVWLVNEDGWARLHGRDLRAGRALPAADLPPGCGTHHGAQLTVSPDGRYAALLWSQPQRADEVYLVELATGHSKRLTGNMLGGLTAEQLTAPTLVSYPSSDDLQVPAWVYRPEQPGRRPVVLSIHGGPETQERPRYQPLYQYLCSRGIGVLAPNIRGSTGYGNRYRRMIYRDWGGGDLVDLQHAVEWLARQDWVDPDRIGVFGGSYGGFATLSCVTRLPEHWAAAVAICSAANLVTWARAVPPTWRRFMARWVGDPDADAEFLRERSPITYADQITAPLLLIQGALDPRAPKAETDELVKQVQAREQEVEYLVFDDEGHGFTRRANRLRAERLTADWFTRHLLGGTRSAAPEHEAPGRQPSDSA